MALKDKREILIKTFESRREYLETNAKLFDVYSGNLLPYLQASMKNSLSEKYYNSIKDRLASINILTRYIDKVSTAYSKPPKRTEMSDNKMLQDFVDIYSTKMSINNSGMVIDSYSNLFKGYAWEPFVDLKGVPQLRELPFDRFFLYSESESNPEQETIFVKIIGKRDDKWLFFSYSNEEFDAFYSDKSSATQYLQDNGGVNLFGTIPFVYGKRDKNRLYPVQDTDLYGITLALPSMISDGAGAQMYQAFSVLYGIDVDSDNLTISPNAFWNFKSNTSSDKQPSVGVLNPTADTEKIISFATGIFTMWLETKGIRVGAVGSVDGTQQASGISKILDEMDVYDIKKKSIGFYKKDEEELWNEKMKKIHNYWIDSGSVDPSKVPPRIPDGLELEVEVNFEEPKPFISRSELVTNLKAEVEAGFMTREDAIREAHPEYTDEKIKEVMANRELF